MKKLSKLLLVVLAVVCLSVVFTSCFLFPDDTTTTTTKPAPGPSTDPVIESISVSGQKTDFFTGDEFATGDLLVTLHYDDGTSTEATAEQYTVDSSEFVKETAGEYEITVALNDSDIKTSYTVTVVDPVATSISLASQRTVFLTGDEFSVGEMVVTLHYNNGSTSVVPADQYTVDSSAFNKDAAGEYKITVSLNGTEFSAEYIAAVDTRYYDVTLPEGIILNTGVENGKTTVNATITFTAEAPAEGKHNVVKVNGTAITPVDGVYSVKASDYLTTLDATIVVTIAQEAHAFGEWVDGEDSRTHTCACGASETENKISVTLKLNNGEADKTVKLYAGEKLTGVASPTKTGYTFRAWQVGGVDFDLDTTITAPMTLEASYAPNTDTAYVVEFYEQNKADGTFVLKDTKNYTGTTGETATADPSAYTVSDAELKLHADHANAVASGEIAADGSLVLKLYYSYLFTVTFERGGETVATMNVEYGGKVSAADIETKAGYTSAWTLNGNAFDFDTAINSSIVLTQKDTANTDTPYKVECYVQGIDGQYKLAETFNKTGTTDTNAQVDGSAYTPAEHLFYDADHDGNVLSGNIAGDGSLVLKLYYSYHKVTAYSLDGLNCAALIVTFDAVDDGKMALLEIRDDKNELVEKVYAKIASNVAEFDLAGKSLAGKYAVISVDSAAPAIISVVTKDNVVASANPFELLATQGNGTFNGVAVSGPGVGNTCWVDGYGIKTNASGTIAYKGEGGFDRGVVTVSVLSFCGSGGVDKIFIQDGSGTTLGSLATDYGVAASKDISFTGDVTALKFITYVYCDGPNGWAGCPGDPETIAAHGKEWCRVDKVVYYKEFTLESTKLLAINGKEAEYIAPTEIVRYESKFYGDLQSINVAVSSGTSAQINIYENGIQIGETLSADVNNGVAKFDVTSLKLANTTIQIEVLGDASVSNINLDTIDYINVGEALYNGCTDYHGGMAFKNTPTWLQMDAEGKFRAGSWLRNGSKLFVFDFANIKDNLVKFDFIGKCFSVCNDGGNERMFLMGIDNNQNQTICGPKNGSADSIENVKTLSLEKSRLGSKTACDVTVQFGCNNSNATTKAEHLAQEYLTLEITATLSYTAEAVTLYK